MRDAGEAAETDGAVGAGRTGPMRDGRRPGRASRIRRAGPSLRLATPPIVVGLLVAAALSACQPTRPTWIEFGQPVARPVVDRVEHDVLRIRWPTGFTRGPVAIYASEDPVRFESDATRSGPLLRTLDDPVRIEDLDPFTRYYFELVPTDGGTSRVVAERLLPLSGTDNFRDIGGYETADGRAVRWGRLYRSDDLASLSSRDVRYLASLRIRLVCDFRSTNEQARAPNTSLAADASDASPTTENLDIETPGVDPDALRGRILRGDVTGPELEQTMLDAYRAFVTDFQAEWRAMFSRMADPSSFPTVVHCTAGKDRTGFASAMLLSALGVPEDIVFDDYLASNVYRADAIRFLKRVIPIASLFRTDPDDLLPLLDVRRPYLEASFDTIREHYGSVDRYLEEALGVTDEMRAELHANLLRRPPTTP